MLMPTNDNAALSDPQLLQACRNGDERAWAQLLDKYERLVYSIPLNYGLRREDAADIAQMAFTALIQSLDSLDAESNLGGWLATVARRHTWRVLKRHKGEVLDALDGEGIIALMPGKTNEIERWELVEWLHKGLLLVGERCRSLLTALYFEAKEPSYAEIAQRLNMPEGSIGPTRARCLQRMQAMLGERA